MSLRVLLPCHWCRFYDMNLVYKNGADDLGPSVNLLDAVLAIFSKFNRGYDKLIQYSEAMHDNLLY